MHTNWTPLCPHCGKTISKLAAVDIPHIWERSLTENDTQLAQHYAVTPSVIRSVLRMKTWKRVSEQVCPDLRAQSLKIRQARMGQGRPRKNP